MRPFCIVVPARNEASRFPRLLAALAAQEVPGTIPVVLVLNNCGDESRPVAKALRGALASRLDLHIDTHEFPADRANAGAARRRGFGIALELLHKAPDGLIISTDADATPPPSWLAEILRTSRSPRDIIGGRLRLDSGGGPFTATHALWHAWAEYWRLVREIEDAIDPRDWDPPPRHGDHTGASLAISTALYRETPGIRELAVGEDVTLVSDAVQAGGLLKHPSSVWTRVSDRTSSFVAGGMATALAGYAKVCAATASPCASDLEHWRQRAYWRRELRSRPGGTALIARLEPQLPPMPLDRLLLPLLRESLWSRHGAQFGADSHVDHGIDGSAGLGVERMADHVAECDDGGPALHSEPHGFAANSSRPSRR